ncbi:unnamed protein product [Withania somnifera]
MEILPVKATDRYKIEARNLAYKLPPKYNEFKWVDKKLATNNKTSTYILRNVNCEAKPGEITAVAGPSRAGKTTLLDILAGNVDPSRVSGHVLVNDQPMKPAKFRRISALLKACILEKVTLKDVKRNKKVIMCLTKTPLRKLYTPILHSRRCLILSQRFCRNIFRTKQLFLAKVIQALLVGLILGSIFFNAYSNPKKLELQSQVGFFAFSLTFLPSSNTEALPIFLEERRILMRETSRGAYRIYTYNIANTIVFLPFLFIVALLYAIPVYWLVGLKYEFSAFAYYTLVSWMIFAMGNSFVAACSALVPNFLLGMSFIGCFIGAFFLFSGYFISKESIPMFWLFVHYLSLFKYPFGCFLINEYGGESGKLKCIQKVDGVCLMYGEELLTRYSLEESQKWFNIAIMLSFTFVYRFLCFLILWYRSSRNKC